MNNNGNTILGILAGGAIGALLGILFAPDKGINTRQKVLDEALTAKEKLSETVKDLKDKLELETTLKKESLEEQLDTILTNASYKADDLISSLEKKLAILKERNKTFQEEGLNKKTSNQESTS
jgi:gas vesicle protein